MIKSHASNLDSFLKELDQDYQNHILAVPLFDSLKTAAWNQVQIQLFASIFYHIRGYFINFAWYIANFTKDKQIKQLILDNIAEEIGLNTQISHEMLYERFAKACGVDIQAEIIDQTHLLPFAKEFNRQHIQWLNEHSPESFIAVFAAYERLDNIDYIYLAKLGQSLGLTQHDLTFFNVHIHVEHFNATSDQLTTFWEKEPETVKEAFHFIYNHQHQMWQTLSDIISSVE